MDKELIYETLRNKKYNKESRYISLSTHFGDVDLNYFHNEPKIDDVINFYIESESSLLNNGRRKFVRSIYLGEKPYTLQQYYDESIHLISYIFTITFGENSWNHEGVLNEKTNIFKVTKINRNTFFTIYIILIILKNHRFGFLESEKEKTIENLIFHSIEKIKNLFRVYKKYDLLEDGFLALKEFFRFLIQSNTYDVKELYSIRTEILNSHGLLQKFEEYETNQIVNEERYMQFGDIENVKKFEIDIPNKSLVYLWYSISENISRKDSRSKKIILKSLSTLLGVDSNNFYKNYGGGDYDDGFLNNNEIVQLQELIKKIQKKIQKNK